MPKIKYELLYGSEKQGLYGEDLIRNVYERLGSIEAKLDGIKEVRLLASRADEKAEKAKNIAEEALASNKSAHHSLDKLAT
ncbi:hypothetical protein ACWV26_06765 [Rummeliibacillus sp. JY-2-4R]